jgi:hypothetical protein
MAAFFRKRVRIETCIIKLKRVGEYDIINMICKCVQMLLFRLPAMLKYRICEGR